MTTRKRASTPLEKALKALAKQQAALTTKLNTLLEAEATRAEKELADKKAEALAQKKADLAKAKAKAKPETPAKTTAAKDKPPKAKSSKSKPSAEGAQKSSVKKLWGDTTPTPVVPLAVVTVVAKSGAFTDTPLDKPKESILTPVTGALQNLSKALAGIAESKSQSGAVSVQSIPQPTLVEVFNTATGIPDTPVEPEKPVGVWPFPVLKSA